jgi:hypothetical protein
MALKPAAPGEIAYFIPPEAGGFPGALGRYLRPLPANVLDAYIAAYTRPGDVVLDPFAHTDSLARVAAHEGRKAVLSDLNPLTAFVARTTLLPVTGRDFHLAFLRLAEAKQAEQPLAEHLSALYETTCPRCGGKPPPFNSSGKTRWIAPSRRRVAVPPAAWGAVTGQANCTR